MLPVILAFTSTIFFAAQSLCSKRGLVHGSNPFTCVLLNVSSNAAFLWIIALAWEPQSLLRTPYVWMFAGLGVLVPGVARHFYFIGLHHMGPSRASVLGGVTPLMSSLAAILLFGEPFRVQTSLGTIAIVAGIILISFERDERVIYEKRYLLFPLLASGLWAVRDNLTRFGLQATSSPFTAAAVAVTGASLFYLALAALPAKATQTSYERSSSTYFIASGFFSAIAYVFVYLAFNLGQVIQAGPAIYTSGLMTILLSLIFLRRIEIITSRVIVAGLIIVAGVVIISFD